MGLAAYAERFAAAGLAIKGFIDAHPVAFPPIVVWLPFRRSAIGSR